MDADFAYKTIEEYESIVGFEVDDAFRMAWKLARLTNKQLGIQPEKTPCPVCKGDLAKAQYDQCEICLGEGFLKH